MLPNCNRYHNFAIISILLQASPSYLVLAAFRTKIALRVDEGESLPGRKAYFTLRWDVAYLSRKGRTGYTLSDQLPYHLQSAICIRNR